MSKPSPEKLEREKDKFYLLDAELCRRLGVPEKTMRALLPALERKMNFPQKQPLFGGRRYWPAVKLWLDRHNGIVPDETTRPSGLPPTAYRPRPTPPSR